MGKRGITLNPESWCCVSTRGGEAQGPCVSTRGGEGGAWRTEEHVLRPLPKCGPRLALVLLRGPVATANLTVSMVAGVQAMAKVQYPRMSSEYPV